MADDDDWATAVEQHIAQMRVTAEDPASTNNQAISSNQVQPNQNQHATGDNNQSNSPENGDAAEESLISKILASKLLEVSKTAQLDVQQRDPNSPLFSAKSFEELNLTPEILKGLRAMNYMKPSKIQETALPLLLKTPPENMIAQSQSGTGKTAAFSLTVLSKVNINIPEPQALILSPTYELALQTGLVVDKMGQFLGVQDLIAYAVKGNRISRGTKITQPIVIGTPGSVVDWITRHKAFDATKLRILVLDEADIMINTQGHKDQTVRIKRSLNIDTCQCLLFSATYDERVLKFAKSIVKNPNILTLRREDETLDNIKQYYVRAPGEEKKLSALFNIYGILGTGQAVIFCKTKKTAKQVAVTMNAQGFAVALLSSDLGVEERANCIRRFQQGLERVLISTNVTSRGIDVEQVTMVVNFDLPDHRNEETGRLEADCETYLHRIGRTGRFGKQGIAINMISDDRDRDTMKTIEAHFKIQIEPLDPHDIDDMERKLDQD
jgi:ATP-dependent RNA helicase DDX19/DBP5